MFLVPCKARFLNSICVTQQSVVGLNLFHMVITYLQFNKLKLFYCFQGVNQTDYHDDCWNLLYGACLTDSLD